MDFPALAARLLTSADSLLSEWFPSGKRRGNEWILGNLRGEPGSSLSINVTTGAWSDFAAGQSGGDLISLFAAKSGITNAQAYRVLIDSFPTAAPSTNGTHAAAKRQTARRRVISPVPDDAPQCTCRDSKLGLPVRISTYRTADGKLSGYVARYEPKDEDERESLYAGRSKQVKPWTYGGAPGKAPRWERGGWEVPRPLYGLDDLAARPNAPVLLVEGEPAADVARVLASQYVVMTWQAGVAGVEYADFTPLYGRSLLLWPDADDPGVDAAWKIARILMPHCPQVKLISPDGQPEGWDAADFVKGNPDAGWPQFKEWAVPRLRTLTPEDVATHFAAPPQPAAPPSQEIAVPSQEPAVSSHAVPVQPPELPSKGQRKVNWYLWDLDCTGQGEPLANLNNAVTVLERDGVLQGLVWYDEFLNRVLTPVPNQKPREWTDADDINLTLDLQRRIGVTKISVDLISKAVVAIAMRNVKHCVRDWVDTLVWDGVPRIDHFFEDHFGAEKTEYTTAASRNFWLSMLARVYHPGCKVDNVVVLEGAEGLGKSTVLQVIAGDWFTEQHESLMNPKAFFEVIQGALITEIGEMEAFNRAELTKVMAVITCRSDKYRDAYGRRAEHHPRQGIFVCTTNERTSNRSPDGGRRWWYVACNEVDTGSVAANREQYFAEARTRLAPESGWNHRLWRFNAGEPWWMMPGNATREQQAARYQADIWAPAIEEYVRLKPYVTIPEILAEALNTKPDAQNTSKEMRVSNTLKYLGWTRKLEWNAVAQKTQRLWRPPEK